MSRIVLKHSETPDEGQEKTMLKHRAETE